MLQLSAFPIRTQPVLTRRYDVVRLVETKGLCGYIINRFL